MRRNDELNDKSLIITKFGEPTEEKEMLRFERLGIINNTLPRLFAHLVHEMEKEEGGGKVKYNLATSMSDRMNFDEAVRKWAHECAGHSNRPLTQRMLEEWREGFLCGLLDTGAIDTASELDEAIHRFNNTFTSVYAAHHGKEFTLNTERCQTQIER